MKALTPEQKRTKVQRLLVKIGFGTQAPLLLIAVREVEENKTVFGQVTELPGGTSLKIRPFAGIGVFDSKASEPNFDKVCQRLAYQDITRIVALDGKLLFEDKALLKGQTEAETDNEDKNDEEE